MYACVCVCVCICALMATSWTKLLHRASVAPQVRCAVYTSFEGALCALG